jgi:hypothetical protein
MSKEQFKRDEIERNRQKHVQLLKEQYQNYEKSTDIKSDTPTPAESLKNETEIKINENNSESGATVVSSTTTQPTWRNVIGQGNVPTINKESEFPSLNSESN